MEVDLHMTAAVVSASKQLHSKAEQQQQQSKQQQSADATASHDVAPSLEALRMAKSIAAGAALDSMQAPTASGNSSPLKFAGLSAPSLQHVPPGLEHKASNLSSYSSMLPSLQHALSGLGSTALNRTLSISSNSLAHSANRLRAHSATAAEFLSRLEAAKAAQQQTRHAMLEGQHASQHQLSKLGSAGAAAADANNHDMPLVQQGGNSDTSCATGLSSVKSSQLAAKAQEMFSLLGQLSQLQQQQQQVFGSAAAPAASGDSPSGLTGGDLAMCDTINSATMAASVPAAAAATTAATPSAAQSFLSKLPQGFGFQSVELQRVLEDVVKNKHQAAKCIREAATLGLFPDFLLQSLHTAVTPLDMEIGAAIAKATGLQQQQQVKAGAKRPRSPDGQGSEPSSEEVDATGAATEDPPTKLHRLADGSAVEHAIRHVEAEVATAEAASRQDVGLKLHRNLSNSSSSTDAAAVEAAAPTAALATAQQTCAEDGQQQQGQQKDATKPAATATDDQPSVAPGTPAELSSAADQAIRDLPQIWSKIAAAAAAPADSSMTQAQQLLQQQQVLMSPAARDLFNRTVLVMSRSQKLCKQLAYMVLPAVQEAQAARQQLQQQQQAMQATTRLDVQGWQALQGAVQQLKQQLLHAKVTVHVKQQSIVKLHQELQAATAEHTQQLEGVATAVRQLMAVANRDGLPMSDKQQLVEIAATILSAVVKQK